MEGFLAWYERQYDRVRSYQTPSIVLLVNGQCRPSVRALVRAQALVPHTILENWSFCLSGLTLGTSADTSTCAHTVHRRSLWRVCSCMAARWYDRGYEHERSYRRPSFALDLLLLAVTSWYECRYDREWSYRIHRLLSWSCRTSRKFLCSLLTLGT